MVSLRGWFSNTIVCELEPAAAQVVCELSLDEGGQCGLMPDVVVVQLLQMVCNDGVERGHFWLVANEASGWKQDVSVMGIQRQSPRRTGL